jgi:hypothetical protein
MDQQPKIPTLKDAQKPQVKIKGMGAGLTLFDRLKQFKKKDLAFILAGLGTLFMAPLAEHFMMAPEGGDANLEKGWGGGKGGGAGIFGNGTSPYENGNNGIAQGGAVGGAGDIITPLNVRDPSALVMGPGAAQQPNAGSVAPPAPPPTAPAKSETDYKDALAGAASRAASAAVKKAPLPIPKIAVGGSGLRGLGVISGGTSAGSGNLAVGPAAGSNGSGGGGSLGLVHAAPNFRGVAGARSPTGGALDGTKRAGANAGDAFSRTGSALNGLNAAASEQIPTGGTGFNGGGQGGAGSNDKGPGGNGAGGSKSVGESLAFIEAKERMMENLKLEFEKRKLKDPELLLYGIRNDSLKAMAAEMTKSLTKGIIGFMDPSSAGNSDFTCQGTINGGVPRTQMTPACGDGSGGTPSVPMGGCWKIAGTIAQHFPSSTAGADVTCTANGKAGPGTSTTQTAPSTAPGGLSPVQTISPAPATAGSVDKLCTSIDDVLTVLKTPASGSVAVGGAPAIAAYTTLRGNAANLLVARNGLVGGNPDKDCGGPTTINVREQHPYVTQQLINGSNSEPGAVPGLVGIVAKKTEDGQGALTAAQGKITPLKQKLDEAQAKLTAAETALNAIPAPFAVPVGETNPGLAAAFTSANTLKTDLVANLTAAKARQVVLVKAQADADATAKGTAGAILKTNTEFEKIRSAGGIPVPDAEPAPPANGATPPAAAPRNYAEVQALVTAADTAIKKACGGQPCTVPATPAPVQQGPINPDVQAAVDAVTNLRQAQRGYLGAITTAVNPTAAPTTTAATTQQ